MLLKPVASIRGFRTDTRRGESVPYRWVDGRVCANVNVGRAAPLADDAQGEAGPSPRVRRRHHRYVGTCRLTFETNRFERV